MNYYYYELHFVSFKTTPLQSTAPHWVTVAPLRPILNHITCLRDFTENAINNYLTDWRSGNLYSTDS
jgi:hypothetical protein